MSIWEWNLKHGLRLSLRFSRPYKAMLLSHNFEPFSMHLHIARKCGAPSDPDGDDIYSRSPMEFRNKQGFCAPHPLMSSAKYNRRLVHICT